VADGLWTLDELVQRVAAALGGGGAYPGGGVYPGGGAYPGAPNGRVRELPDRRAVRWYATIGLVDRPAATRGRTALYGHRHLWQLVAVKRRQAAGLSLADIQAELAGAPDSVLRRIADVPDALLAPTHGDNPAPPPAPGGPVRTRFWAANPAAVISAVDAPAVDAPSAPVDGDSVRALTGVALPGGGLLLLPGAPTPDELAAVRTAAQPLIDLLADMHRDRESS
jgi:hypothetical protein